MAEVTRARVIAIAKDTHPVLAVVISLAAIVGFAWAIGRYLFAPPPLAISFETSPLTMPSYIYENLARAIAIDSTKLSDSTGLWMRQARGFLRDTRTFTRITLTNATASSLVNVDLRLSNVRDADGWMIEGDALDGAERRQLLDAVRHDGVNEILTLRTVPKLPPHSSFTLSIWGDVAPSPFLGDRQLVVTYDGGIGTIVPERKVRGLDAFVYDNSGLLLLLILLVNLAVVSWLLERRRTPGQTAVAVTQSAQTKETTIAGTRATETVVPNAEAAVTMEREVETKGGAK